MINKDKAPEKAKEKGKDDEDRIPVTPSPTPNAVQEQMKEKTQDAKNPATIPYVEPMMQVTQIPNTYPPFQGNESESNKEATLKADKGPRSVENTDGLERDPQHPGIVHSAHGHDRIETEAEKAARRGDAGVNLGQPRSVTGNAEPLPSKSLSAEQEAGRKALDRKHSPQAKEAERDRSKENEREREREKK